MLLRPLIRATAWLRLAVPSLLLGACLLLANWTERAIGFAESPLPVTQTLRYQSGMVASSTASGVLKGVPVALVFEPGETLGGVLGGFGLSGTETTQLVGQLAQFADLRRLKPGDQYAARLAGKDLSGFELVVAGKGVASADRRGGKWEVNWHQFERSVHRNKVDGILEGALETSIEAAGGEASLSLEMADVLQWDLDFTRDLRRGDRFRVLYERVHLDGRYESIGGVVALIYENRGDVLEAYRFGTDNGYYDAEGRPLRKMFLRSPLRYSRITSRFSRRRFHPILKLHRPHHGVDYGAPTGTPVRATGNGTVLSAGWDRGGGRTIKVRHPNNFVTAYLHLSRFADGVRRGKRVTQGSVIGYVGSTGLSTAPHLDYRVQKNGRWIDPLSLKSVPTEPLETERMPEFMAWRDEARRSLGKEPFEPTDRVLAAGIGGSSS
ncbi:MAG: peptidoglycan DD-metalloendopeptidase family protein [Acidobacteriota bacterium]|nr:peptidoglycan DD-metalloendopeptidase family protein [Acidobacteriota bacterium]